MSRSDDLRLMDILEAGERISRMKDRGRRAYDEDEAIQPAVERLLEIIGESANALHEKTCDEIPGVEWADLRKLRIVLAHHYHRVDPEQVWAMATVDIPDLLAAIRQARPNMHIG